VVAAVVSFSTLYRVDAIEGPERFDEAGLAAKRFSTLYRVDAIEGGGWARAGRDECNVSVPSIGSMLLKAVVGMHDDYDAETFQYPLSGRCY